VVIASLPLLLVQDQSYLLQALLLAIWLLLVVAVVAASAVAVVQVDTAQMSQANHLVAVLLLRLP
jgi:hypothetical protein